MIPIIIPMQPRSGPVRGGAYGKPTPEQLAAIPYGELYAIVYRNPRELMFPWSITVRLRDSQVIDTLIESGVAQTRWGAYRLARRIMADHAKGEPTVEIVRREI